MFAVLGTVGSIGGVVSGIALIGKGNESTEIINNEFIIPNNTVKEAKTTINSRGITHSFQESVEYCEKQDLNSLKKNNPGKYAICESQIRVSEIQKTKLKHHK